MSDNPTCPQFPARPPHGGEPFIVPPAPRRRPGLPVLSVNGHAPDGHGDLALTYIDGAEYAAGYGDPPGPALLFRQGDEVVAVVDATPLLRDGMVSSVEVSGGKLVVTFNTDAGKEPVEIPLTDIFDPANYYDKTAADGRFALKGEMSVAAGAGADADKTTITLMPGVLATVLSAHQPLDAYFNAAEYDSAGRKILLKHGTTVKAQIDATAFIKDGMVSSVAISNGKLVITFNTDAGLEPIEIPLTDIFDPENYYDKTAVDTRLSYKADKVADATHGHFAALTSTGNLVDSGKKAEDFAAASHTHTASAVTDLGDAATMNVGTTSGTVAAGDDSRLSDARTPTAHKSSHATGGSDAIAPSDIGAAASSHTHAASDITSGLATVATSGDYSDLTNKPTIPAAQVQSNWNESDASSKAYIQNKPTIPTIPTPVAPASATASGQFADAYETQQELTDKVSGYPGMLGNIVVFDVDAAITDSGYAPSDFATHADIPSASSTTPSMDGTAAVGVSTDYARADHVHPTDTSRVAANAAITGATKCKITYDSKGLVTGGADLAASDIPTLTTAKLSDFDAAIRYAMPTAVALVPEDDAATLVCADRAVTNATIASGFSTLNLTFPAAVSGYVRDFYLRITVAAGESAPALSLPQGVTIENPDGAVPEIADGEASAAATTLVWFSETAPGIFTAKSETVKAVV